MADNLPKKNKRRIRPATQTVREQAQQSTERVKNVSQKGPIRRLLGFVFRPLGFLKPPLIWLGRHIIPRYFRHSYQELKLVSWPNRKESRQLTSAVIIFAIVFGFFITVLDYGLDKVFKKVFLR